SLGRLSFLAYLPVGTGYPPPPRSFGIMGLGRRNRPGLLILKDLELRSLRTKQVARSVRFAQDFGSGLPLRSRPLNASSCQRALKMGLGQFRGPSGRRAHSTLPQSDVYYLSSRPTNLKSTDFDRGCLWVRVARTLPSTSLRAGSVRVSTPPESLRFAHTQTAKPWNPSCEKRERWAPTFSSLPTPSNAQCP